MQKGKNETKKPPVWGGFLCGGEGEILFDTVKQTKSGQKTRYFVVICYELLLFVRKRYAFVPKFVPKF